MLSLPTGGISQSVPGAEILRQLRGFREMGSVLYIAAHPDDENTELITYFARGEKLSHRLSFAYTRRWWTKCARPGIRQ
jgi:hypothetical protein